MRLVFVSSIVFLTSCATPYQKESLWNSNGGGYSDSEISQGVYKVRFKGNGYTSAEQTEKLWNQRASDLCKGKDYSVAMNPPGSDESPMAMTGGVAIKTAFEFPVVSGVVTCNP